MRPNIARCDVRRRSQDAHQYHLRGSRVKILLLLVVFATPWGRPSALASAHRQRAAPVTTGTSRVCEGSGNPTTTPLSACSRQVRRRTRHHASHCTRSGDPGLVCSLSEQPFTEARRRWMPNDADRVRLHAQSRHGEKGARSAWGRWRVFACVCVCVYAVPT